MKDTKGDCISMGSQKCEETIVQIDFENDKFRLQFAGKLLTRKSARDKEFCYT